MDRQDAFATPTARLVISNLSDAPLSHGSTSPTPVPMSQAEEAAKAPRIQKACESCRRKKTRCDGQMPACASCIKHNRQCVFRQVEKKRVRSKGGRYVDRLEKRLGRMEALLKTSGLLAEDGLPRQAINSTSQITQNSSESRPQSQVASKQDGVLSPMDISNIPHGSEREASPLEAEIEALSDGMCSLMTNELGETKYIGSASGFSIFSPKGVEWTRKRTGNTHFQEIVDRTAANQKFHHLDPNIFGSLFQRPVYEPLPNKKECLALLDQFFCKFNCLIPIFSQPEFMCLAERQFSSDPHGGLGWWACLNVALAISCRLCAASSSTPKIDERRAKGYLKNAMSVVSALMMDDTDLFTVQALLGIALLLHCTSNPQPSFILIANAIRLSHNIGLHKRGSTFNLKAEEIEERKHVFWIAYILDKEISLLTGRPPIQNDDDMNIDFPSSEPINDVGCIVVQGTKLNLLRLISQSAMIQNKVYWQLYSAKAAKLSIEKYLDTIEELDNQLEEWKRQIPADLQPTLDMKKQRLPLALPLIVMNFTYYNCLKTIHQMSIYCLSQISKLAAQGLDSRSLGPRADQSAHRCVSAARCSLNLLQYLSQEDPASVWVVLHYPVSSVVTLFNHIIQNREDSNSPADVLLIGKAATFLSSFSNKEKAASLKKMHAVCVEFERIANSLVEESRKQASGSDRPESTANPPERNSLPLVSPQQSLFFDQFYGGLAISGSTTTESMMPDFGTTEFGTGCNESTDISMSLFPQVQLSNNAFTLGGLDPVNNLNMFDLPFAPQHSWYTQMPPEP